MNYKETLDYLFAKLPMFSRIGAAALKPSLDNTLALCEALGNPQNKFKTIHIAGTNGKGSTSHQLASILQEANYKVGLYTSPHLKDFRERIKINGALCDKDFIIDFVKKTTPIIEAINPSFFEVTVAMAFEYFALQKVDVAVIEVGMGGRLDSTNIITPILSIITNIGFDHMQFLGNTYQAIATEKAGIIKPNIPVIIGEYNTETNPVFAEIAQKNNSPIILAQNNWQVVALSSNSSFLTTNVHSKLYNKTYTLALDLLGRYQLKNIVQVMEAFVQLNELGFIITENNLHQGLANCKKNTGFYGRWDVLQQKPTVIADVAHNEDGIKQIVHQLEYLTYKKLHFVLGMVKDKDVNKVLQLLPKSANYYFTNATIERAMPAKDLQILGSQNNLFGNSYNNVDIALKNALKNASDEDVIIICGSIFLIAEINHYNYFQN
ncbi:MAG: bifunctional folylpolyglutamate synthase/dihydrofolate synthase [Chitinophagaceae bacterium]